MDKNDVMRDSVPAPGEMITLPWGRLHVQMIQNHSTAPWILLECGLTMMSACWGWLAPEIASRANLLLYDRAGLGWSDETPAARDVAQTARECDALIQCLGLKPPFVLLGHSMGAMVNRAFVKLHFRQVSAVIWLDASHPDQMNRNTSTGRRIRRFFFLLEAAQLLAGKKIPKFELPLLNQIKGLPDEEFKSARAFLRDSKHLRNSVREARAWPESANFVRGSDLGDVPLLLISAQKHALPGWGELQKELTAVSNRSRHLTFTDASHVSLLTRHELARKTAGEITGFLTRTGL
jgi:pimeloyl-ACP methyl ester carboxylesterase